MRPGSGKLRIPSKKRRSRKRVPPIGCGQPAQLAPAFRPYPARSALGTFRGGRSYRSAAKRRRDLDSQSRSGDVGQSTWSRRSRSGTLRSLPSRQLDRDRANRELSLTGYAGFVDKRHSQSSLPERIEAPRLPSRNWPLSRASLQLTTLGLGFVSRCAKTNRRRSSPQACASGVEREPVQPARNERRHR